MRTARREAQFAPLARHGETSALSTGSKRDLDSGTVIIAERLLGALSVLLIIIPGMICGRLTPSLTRPFRRLAILFLVVIMLLNAIALLMQPHSPFDQRLWSLSLEQNAASTLSSVLLAITGGALVAVAWLVRKKRLAFGVYILLMGLVILFLGLDDYYGFKDYVPNWQLRYSMFGAAFVLTTAVVAWHAPRSARYWLIWLMIGLAFSAAGAIAIDLLPKTCERIGPILLDRCLPLAHLEEAVEIYGFWVMMVAALGLLSASGSISPAINRLVAIVLPALWLLSLAIIAFVPRLELRIMSERADVRFERSLRLRGYRIDQLSDKVVLQLYPSAEQNEYLDQGFSARLVDQVTGEWVASHDSRASSRRMVWFLGADFEQVHRHQMVLTLPPEAPTNRAMWIVLSAWRGRPRNDQRQRILSSDHRQLNDTQVLLGELALPAASSGVTASPLAIFDGSLTLGEVELPQSARLGETLHISFSWRADAAGSDDYAQFLHLGHIESGEWWVYDQQPLGPRLPTRLWYSGLADSEIWAAPLPTDLAAGEYAAFTGLYRLSDRERVPVRGRDGKPFVDARVPLGFLTLE